MVTGTSTADLLRSGLATAAAGGKLDSNTIDQTNPGATSGNGISIDEEIVTGAESTTDDLMPDSGDAPEDQAEGTKEPASSEGKDHKLASVKEVITVTDADGKRRKVEIDYSDRKAIKKAFELQSGARKWQAERDQARQQLAGIQKTKGELESNWQALEQAFQQNGTAGVIDLLEGKPGAYKDWERKAVQKARFLEEATPDQIQAMTAQEQADTSKRELARIRKENEDFRKQMTQTKEEAQLHSLESRVNPVFDKYRFADKLGDANDELMFDEMLWNSALKRLEPYEEQGLEISPELVDREFRAVASSLRKRIGLQAEKKAARVVDQKKQEATENVQAAVKSGYKTGGAAKEARDMIDSRNLTGLLKNWGKYGSVFKK